MKTYSAKDAKNRFGEMMDAAQREPVCIEKHGRPTAVVLSAAEYRQLKIDRLKAELQIGIDQLDRGEGIEYENIGDLFDEINAELDAADQAERANETIG